MKSSKAPAPRLVPDLRTSPGSARPTALSLTKLRAGYVDQKLSALELCAIEAPDSRTVEIQGPRTVTVTCKSDKGTMTVPMARGMSHLVAMYENLTPRLRVASPGTTIVSVNGSTTSPVVGKRFEIALSNGQTWEVSTSTWITANWTAHGLAANSPFNGGLRAGLL